VKETIVREQRIRDLLRGRPLHQFGEFFLPRRIWRLHERMHEYLVGSLPRSAIRLCTMQP
jgi:hypothetical protein